MKSFKQFYEGVTQGKTFPTSPFKLTPGKGYPSGVPFINLKGDKEKTIFKWQTSKGDVNKRDYDKLQQKYNKEYKDFMNPLAPRTQKA